jgi:caffeoyl-CoA O-methyltransferase
MQLVPEKVESYAKRFTSPSDELIQLVEQDTEAHHKHAHMLSGSTQGKLLEFVSMMLKPLKILEIGTFTGFSALSLVKGLQPGGVLHTIELRKEDADTAQKYFDESIHKDRIHLHQGDAMEIVPSMEELWDLVFIDADKVNYINYYELTLQKLNVGGFIIVDNVLFHGQVLEDHIKGKNAVAIHAFNEHVRNDRRVEQVFLTVRDGIMIIKKI